MAQEPVAWRDAPDLALLAAPILRAHHPHLAGIPIRFVWRSEMRTLRGSKAAGTCEIVTGRFAFFVMTEEEEALAEEAGCSGRMFWIEIAADAWDGYDDHQRLALLDHEISHAGVERDEEKEGIQLVLIPHDSEEFTAIVNRYGAWDSRIQALVNAADAYAARAMFE